MYPSELSIGHYLRSETQFQIPDYQRPYEWESNRWRALWRDISQQYRFTQGDPDYPSHFMGATIVAPEPSPQGTIQSYSVIDGQQRLLTLFIMMAAFRDHQIFLSGVDAVAVQNSLNTITPDYAPSAPRLIGKKSDRGVLDAILAGAYLKEISKQDYESQPAQAYRFYRFQYWRGLASTSDTAISEPPRPSRKQGAPAVGSYAPWGEPALGTGAIDPAVLTRTIHSGLKVLQIRLDPTDEDRSIIFETMNSKGTPLKQFDLARNSTFVRLPSEKNHFHTKEWEPAEQLVGAVSYGLLRDDPREQFFYEYMISLGNKVSKAEVHATWLDQAIDEVGYGVTAESEDRFLHDFARPFTQSGALYPLAVGQVSSVSFNGQTFEVTPQHRATLAEIMAMSGGPVVPFTLRALRRHAQGVLDDGEFSEILQDLQSYLVRYLLTGETLSPLRSLFIKMAVATSDDDMTLSGLRKTLSENGWRTNDEVLAGVQNAKFTSSSSQYFPVLRGIERHLSGVGAHPMSFGSGADQYSVEHIYPQASNVGKAWEASLKETDTDRASMDARRFVLGNLTAVSNYDNKKNARKAFDEKKKLILACAPLKLHQKIAIAEVWNPQTIDDRTLWMAKQALERWPRNYIETAGSDEESSEATVSDGEDEGEYGYDDPEGD